MKPRKVLLLEIGAGPLPATTPTAPVASSWFPKVYTAPAPAVPGNFAVTAIVGGARITWDAVDGPNITYELQRAPDGLSGPGAWVTVTIGTDRVYNANESAKTWWRVRALQRGVPSGWAVQAPITPTAVPTPEEVAAAQAAADAAQAAAEAAQAGVDSEIAARIAADVAAINAAAADATAKVDAAKAEATARADALQAQLNDFLGQADPWSSITAYPAGDFVSDSGKLYRAKQAVPAGTPLTDTAYWEEMGNYASAGDAISAALAQSTANASEIEAHATRLEGVEARMPAGTDQLATATAVGALDARVTTAEGNISSHASSITALSAEVGGVTQGLSVAFPPDALADWIVPVGAAVQTSYPATAGSMGGYVLRVGNNSGNDEVWARYKYALRIDANKLYRIRVRYRRVTGTGLVSLGLVCLDASKANYVRANNTLIASSGVPSGSHYAVSDAAPALGTWVEQEFYVKGRAAGAASGAWTIASPYQLPAQAAHIAPLFIANYSAAAGETEFDYFIIEDAADKLDSTANASAINALDARVTAAEGVNTSQASSITSLNAQMTAVMGDGYGDSNVVANGNCQQGTAGWVPQNGAVLTTGSYPDGPQFRIAPASGATHYVEYAVPANPGNVFSVGIDCYAAGTAGTFYIDYLFTNASNGVLTDGANTAFPGDSNWRRVTYTTIAAPANTAFLKVRVVASAATWTLLAFKRVKAEIGTVAGPYSEEAATSANASATTALEARVTTAEGNITSSATAITNVKASLGGGGNLLANTDFEQDVSGYTVFNNNWGGSGTLARDLAGDAWRPTGGHTIGYSIGGDVAGYFIWETIHVPARATQRYFASTRMASHRAQSYAELIFFDGSNTQIGAPVSLGIAVPGDTTSDTGGTSESNYPLLGGYAVAPANTRYACIRFVAVRQAASTTTDPYVWAYKPMLCEAQAEATGWIPYSRGTAGLDAKYASVTQTLTANVSSVQGQVNAKYGVYVDVNGRVTGFESANNGISSSFKVLADYFWVVSSAGYDFLKFNSGNLEVSGVLKGSRISASAIDLASLVVNCGSGRLAPVFVTDFSHVGSTTTASRTVTVSDFVSPSYGSGYHYKRFSEFKKDVYLTVTIEQGNTTVSPVIQVQIDGGAWTTIHTAAQYGSNVNTTRRYRYTTPESWSTINFRVTTTNSYRAFLTVEVQNGVQTGNAASSFSDGSAAPTPPPARPPSEEFCVDWETTVVAGGVYVRDLYKGATFPGWRGDPNDLSIVETSLIGMLIGNEQCYLLRHAGEDLIIQSESTPMVLPDGRCVRTNEMLGEHVLDEGTLEWILVDELVDMGVRKVCKPDFAPADLFFAGIDTGTRRIATHNLPVK